MLDEIYLTCVFFDAIIQLHSSQARKMTCDELRLLCAHLNMKARLLLASTQSQVANCSTVFM
eukprot:m.211015 g.211015  ORF g.211015 m.211015 type:complete len:62 (-) comp13784_c1_seq4:513-698(-)